MKLAVLDAFVIKEFPYRTGDLRSHKPHYDLRATIALKLVAVLSNLRRVFILQRPGLQLHQDRGFELILKREVEPSDSRKRSLTAHQHKVLMREKVIGIGRDEVFHVFFVHKVGDSRTTITTIAAQHYMRTY